MNGVADQEDKAIDEMVRKYRASPTNLWLFTDLPVEKRMAVAYLAADEMMGAPFKGDQVRQFIAAVKMVRDKTPDLFSQVRGKDKLRGEYLASMDWTIKIVPLEECGVFPHFGGFPREWSYGNVPDTAAAVAGGIRDAQEFDLKTQKKLASMTQLQSIYMTALKFLPPILVPGGTLRSRDPDCEPTAYDIDDGNHRAVAARMAGETHIVAFVGEGDAYTRAVDSLRRGASVEDVGRVLDEITTTAQVASYDVPLGARPQGRRKRRKPKTPKTIEYR